MISKPILNFCVCQDQMDFTILRGSTFLSHVVGFTVAAKYRNITHSIYRQHARDRLSLDQFDAKSFWQSKNSDKLMSAKHSRPLKMSGCILLRLIQLDPDEFVVIPIYIVYYLQRTLCVKITVSHRSQDGLLITSYKTYRLYILHNFPETTIILQNAADKLTKAS